MRPVEIGDLVKMDGLWFPLRVISVGEKSVAAIPIDGVKEDLENRVMWVDPKFLTRIGD